MLDQIFGALHQATEAGKDAMDSRQRAMVPYLAIVTQNNDPKDLRRIKATAPTAPGIETPWLRRVLTAPQQDPPLPAIGQTVLVLSIDGDPTNGWYLTANNLTNPALGKGNPITDFWDIVKGDRYLTTQGNLTEKVGGDREISIEGEDKIEAQKRDLSSKGETKDVTGTSHEIEVGTFFKLTNTAGASLTLSTAGFIVLADAFGHTITLSGGLGGSGVVWDLGGDSLNLINVGDLTIDGKSVAVVGATDTRGDALVNRGY